MAITTAVCNKFKTGLLAATFNFTQTTGNAYKIALYTSSATINRDTTEYTTGNEVASGGKYTTAGKSLAIGSQTYTLKTSTACVDFANVTWETSTITARGALIYNDTASGDPSVCALNFGGDKTSTSGTFTIQFPDLTDTEAIIRIA